MLDLIRKKQKSAIVKFVFWAIIATFVGTIFLVWGKGRGKDGSDADYAVKVDSVKVSMSDYQTAVSNLYRFYQNLYKEQFTPALEKQIGIPRQAVNQLVDQTLMMQEADRLGIEVSDQEVVDSIAAIPAFQDNGVFNKNRYLDVLRYQRLTPEEFESQQERALLLQKVRDEMEAGVKVTDADVENEYKQQNLEIDLSFIKLQPSQFESKVKVTDADLETYYTDNQEKFRTPEKVSLNYILFEPKNYMADVTVNDKDMEKYYRRHLDEFEIPEQVRASQILIAVPRNADSKTIEEKRALATKVLDEARAGKDFAELVKTYSDDTRSIARNGDLGYFGRGTMMPSFEEAAFNTKPGQIADLVRTSYGYHIIKVTEHLQASIKPLANVLPEVEAGVRKEQAQQLAFEKAMDAYNINRKGGDLAAAAKEDKLTVKDTDLFTMQGPAGPFGNNQDLISSAFTLQPGELARPLNLPEGVVLMALKERVPSAIPQLQDVRAEVEKAYRAEQSVILAQQAADEALKEIKDGKSLGSIAKKYGTKVEETGLFAKSFGSFVPHIGNSEELLTAAFNLTPENPVPDTTFTVAGSSVLVRLKSRDEADMAGLTDAKKKELYDTLLNRKKQEAVTQKLDALRNEAKITISPALAATLERR